ncbi:MAG: nucleotidyltransferase domain-containing protein [Bariatricus sp.]
MCSETELDRITKEMVDCYRTYFGKNIVVIYLYGSYARGDYDNQSDIDITAVVKGDRLDLQNKLKAVWDYSADVALEHDVVISPMVIPYDEFENYKHTLPYYMNIEKEGKRIG